MSGLEFPLDMTETTCNFTETSETSRVILWGPDEESLIVEKVTSLIPEEGFDGVSRRPIVSIEMLKQLKE